MLPTVSHGKQTGLFRVNERNTEAVTLYPRTHVLCSISEPQPRVSCRVYIFHVIVHASGSVFTVRSYADSSVVEYR